MANAPPDPMRRMALLQTALAKEGIDAGFFTYSRTLLYYCGTTHPAILLVTSRDYRLLALRAFEWVKGESWLDKCRISRSAGGYGDARPVLEELGASSGRLGVELDIMPVGVYSKLSAILSGFDFMDISRIVIGQRKIKDADEIACIREAGRIVHKGHERIMEVLKPGMTELDVSAEMEHAHRKAGHEGMYFIRQNDFFMGQGPFASGENLARISGKVQSISGAGLSPSIPMGASLKKIQKGELIVTDIPTHYRGYHFDQSRTYVLGEPPAHARQLYDGLKDIADRIIDIMAPGVSCRRLCRTAAEAADDLGLGRHFMMIGAAPDAGRVPFIGHGLGLELNEPPLLSENNREGLEPGMVIALEMEMGGKPKVAVKLEDTVLITESGAEILNRTPRELHVVPV